MSAASDPINGVWPSVPLGEIAEIKLGKMLDRAKHTTGRKLPYLRNINVRWGSIETDDLLEMHFEEEQAERFSIRDGDVLVCEGGEPGRAAVWCGGPTELKFQKALHRVRFKVPYEPRLLVYLLELLAKGGRLERRFTGSTIKHFTREAFLQLPVPSLSLAEQQRIVTEIEKQLARLDAAEESLQRSKRNLRRYRASVLLDACEGRLGSTDDGGATADTGSVELINTIRPEAGTISRRRAARLWGAGHVPDLTSGELQSIPSHWRWTTVRDLGVDEDSAVQVGPMSMKSSEFSEAGVPVFNVGCVHWGRFDETKLNFLPAENAAAFKRYLIEPGDVLFTRSGTVGRCAVAQRHHDGWLMTFHLLRARTNPLICLPTYLRVVLEGAPHIRRQTRGASIGSTRAGFNTNLLASLAIPLPPLAEQYRIVAEVDRRLSVVDELERVVEVNLQRAKNLRQSILQRAFSGQL
jgi:type I restriction enzyme S subunit